MQETFFERKGHYEDYHLGYAGSTRGIFILHQ